MQTADVIYTRIHRCRSCKSRWLHEVFDLGEFAISDFRDSLEESVDRAPLTLVRCGECTLVQLAHTADRDRLYRRYWYRSATQPAMAKMLQNVVRDACSRVPLQPADVVVDIGANDGTLLGYYDDEVLRIGVEPSGTFSVPESFRSRDRWLKTYWPLESPLKKRAKIITSIACFYDVDDPDAFVAGIVDNLREDGVWVNQLAYLPDTLSGNNFGDICHEHLTYWTIGAFKDLIARYDLMIEETCINTVNGGSVKFIVRHGKQSKFGSDEWERDRVLSALQSFKARVEHHRDILLKVLANTPDIIGYGASTKGNTYLQYWDITVKQMRYVADRNPDKWGKFLPTGQEIISEEAMRKMSPKYLLVLPWHFLDAFVDRERALMETGTKMIVPFPQVRIINYESDLFKANAPQRIFTTSR